MLPVCHFECDDWPLKAYITHLVGDHKLPIYELDHATMFLEFTPPGFFTDLVTYKFQGLGVLKAFSTNFLILAMEKETKYWFYSVRLDYYNEEKEIYPKMKTPQKTPQKKNKEQLFYCSFELKLPPPITTPMKTDGQLDSKSGNFSNRKKIPEKKKFNNNPTNIPLKKQDSDGNTPAAINRPLVQLWQPNEIGVDKVLSLDDSYSTRFDMGRVFQVDKSFAKLFLTEKKIPIHIKIHKIDQILEPYLEFPGILPNESSSLAEENVQHKKKWTKFEYPYKTYTDVDLEEQRRKQEDDDEEDYTEKITMLDEENEGKVNHQKIISKDQEYAYQICIQKANQRKRVQINKELIQIHQAMVQDILTKEKPTLEELFRHQSYIQNFSLEDAQAENTHPFFRQSKFC